MKSLIAREISEAHLGGVQAGQRVRIRSVQADRVESQRLRELGMLEGRTVRIVTNTDPLICQVGNCHLGLCRKLARCVLVEPVKDTHAQSA